MVNISSSDARENYQVLKTKIDPDGVGICLYLKDKRDGSLWVEHHSKYDKSEGIKRLLNPNAKAPSFHLPITQKDIDDLDA